MKCTFICMLIFIVACNNNRNKDNLIGVYTASYEHEYGKTDDTLTLTQSNETEKMYTIERHSGLIKKMDGKEFPKELVTAIWALQYNAAKQTLFELKEGRTLIWNSGTQSLLWGSTAYKKITAQ